MAFSIRQLRDGVLTSIHGRRLGLGADDYLQGPKELRTEVEDITTTAASSFAPYGTTVILTSGSTQLGEYTLQAPVPGTRKRIFLNSTSTGCMLVRASGGALFLGASMSTLGSTVINFLGAGANVILEAVSTSKWLIFGAQSSLVSSDHQRFSFTTST